MDDRLVQDFLAGDLDASGEMKFRLRPIAETILAHPGFRLDDEVGRTRLAFALITEVLQQRYRNLDGYRASAIMTSCRKGLDHLRNLEVGGNKDHVPTGVLVSFALAPDHLAGPALEAARTHTATCRVCADQVAMLQAAASRVHLMGQAQENEVADLGEDTEPEIPVPQPAQSLRVIPYKSPPKRKAAPRKTGRKPVKPQTSRGPVVVVGLVALLALGYGVRAWNRDDERQGSTNFTPKAEVQALARFEVPPLPPASERPKESWPAFQDLEARNCPASAARFRMARMRNPSDGSLWYWEGISWLCANHIDEGRSALDEASRLLGSKAPADLSWFRLQGALLAGDVAGAQHAINRLEFDDAHRPAAEDLRPKLATLKP